MIKRYAVFLCSVFLFTACGGDSSDNDLKNNDTTLQIPQGAKRVSSPTFTFQDDFEQDENSSFWGGSSRGSAYSHFGEVDITDPSNHILKFNYIDQDGHSWSQHDFHLPQVKEVAFLYRLYTPSNYGIPEESNNHKLLFTWSGHYGTNTEGLTIASEMWNDSQNLGKIPSMYIGINDIGSSGGSRGHIYRRPGNEELAVTFQDGKWHNMYIYLKVAPSPNEYGSMEIWRDGVKLVSTDDSPSIVSRLLPSEVISYVNGYNYIDQGYFMGWWNNANLTDNVLFQMDDLHVMAK